MLPWISCHFLKAHVLCFMLPLHFTVITRRKQKLYLFCVSNSVFAVDCTPSIAHAPFSQWLFCTDRRKSSGSPHTGWTPRVVVSGSQSEKSRPDPDPEYAAFKHPFTIPSQYKNKQGNCRSSVGFLSRFRKAVNVGY